MVRHSSNETVSGGATILSFRAAGGGTGESTSTNYDLSAISDLGNSILGGDGTFPNGPDILTVVANIVDSSNVTTNNPFAVSARVTWQESQAWSWDKKPKKLGAHAPFFYVCSIAVTNEYLTLDFSEAS